MTIYFFYKVRKESGKSNAFKLTSSGRCDWDSFAVLTTFKHECYNVRFTCFSLVDKVILLMLQ